MYHIEIFLALTGLGVQVKGSGLGFKGQGVGNMQLPSDAMLGGPGVVFPGVISYYPNFGYKCLRLVILKHTIYTHIPTSQDVRESQRDYRSLFQNVETILFRSDHIWNPYECRARLFGALVEALCNNHQVK